MVRIGGAEVECVCCIKKLFVAVINSVQLRKFTSLLSRACEQE